jgi:hypothetical protein
MHECLHAVEPILLPVRHSEVHVTLLVFGSRNDWPHCLPTADPMQAPARDYGGKVPGSKLASTLD